MRIVCPACAAAYQVPDERLAAGRVVRCARCETDWVPLPEEVPPSQPAAVPPPEPPAPPPVPEQAAEEPPAPPADTVERYATSRPPRRWLLALAWVASVALVVAGIACAVVLRDGVMRVWPPSARAYAALGLTGANVAHRAR